MIVNKIQYYTIEYYYFRESKQDCWRDQETNISNSMPTNWTV